MASDLSTIELADIERFLANDPIAVVGVHRDTRQFANGVHRRLRATGHRVVPVHPEASELDGDPCVPTVADLPDEVDAVLVMVAADRSAEVVQACVDRGVGHIWLHRGGGAGAVSDDAVRIARQAGVVLVPGACPMMFLEPVRGIHRLHRFMSRRRFVATA